MTVIRARGSTRAFDPSASGPIELLETTHGARGYRAAQLEAGIVEGRLHLSAFAVGFGATGLTFFDDDVRSHFGADAWPMLVTAVGKPTSPPAPTGSPGRPAPLRVRRTSTRPQQEV